MGSFQKLSLRSKVLFAIGFMIAMNIGIFTYSAIGLSQVTEKYDHVATINLPNSEALSGMLAKQKEIYVDLLKLADSNENVAERVKEVGVNIEEYETTDKWYQTIPFVEGEAALYDKVSKSWQSFKEPVQNILKSKNVGADRAALATDLKVLDEASISLDASLSALIKFQGTQAKAWRDDASTYSSQTKTIQIIMVCLSGLISLAGGFAFAQILSKSLSSISAEISLSTEQTLSGGQQLAAASTQLSAGASEAAASLEETVASLEELTSMVKMNTDKAMEANKLSQKSREAAESGESEIQKLTSAMGEIAQGSKKIEDIINVIDDIAFQTNLLALNAAVEAARAGEQGKGFAVVAEAVRNLAQRSASAAKDINSLIKDNVEKSQSGAKIAEHSGVVLRDILDSVKKVAQLNDEIAGGSKEQSDGIEQISKAMNSLDQATQSNASSSEEVAASSEQMSQQAQVLSETVRILQGLVHGASGSQAEIRGGDALQKVVAMKARGDRGLKSASGF